MRKYLAGFGCLLATGLLTATLAPSAPSAAAATPATINLVGHGYGHGRGLGQYGAYGYALQGQSAAWILAHYYGGTVSGLRDPSQPIDVRLSELDGYRTIGVQGNGLVVNGQAQPAGPVEITAGSGDTTVSAADGAVAVDLPSGAWRWYQGQIILKGDSTGAGGQTWNHLGLDQYVAGVVPAESPASWGTNGPAALQAQAVAARSYALAFTAGGGPICDTTYCQVYDGDQDRAGTPTSSGYTIYSDQAVIATAGEVRQWPSGSVARTEFSSSTGGYTAGGVFPAVVDDGDGVAGNGNPNHTWTTSIPGTDIQNTFPSIGSLQAVMVTARNGLGDLGGRVTQMVITGTGGHVTLTGDQFAADFGLRSDWFAVTNSGLASGGTNGYWLLASDGGVFSFGSAAFYGSTGNMALNRPIVGMAATSDQGGYWLVASDGGVFSFGDATYRGSTGNIALNRPVLGMTATPDGGGYWLYAGDGGIFSFGDAAFYGSTGNIRLNQPIVGMATTPDGRGYWLVAADGGVFSFGDATYYGSTGNIRLNQPIVGMVPSADRRGYSLVGRDGGIFTFGDAQFVGSLPGLGISDVIASVASTGDGGGYLEISAGGRVYPFGDAPYLGDLQSGVPGWHGTAIGIVDHSGP
ncbi:MAG: hypothetical protein M3R71_00300 [Actinomycetota bacterium]|nr:hypothetical protein [Actinomycetota bacterium]